MQANLKFLTLPTADTPGTAAILQFDDKHYIFGRAAEGLQRATIQRNTALTKVSDFFLTGNMEWSSIGGLLGFVLTKADQNESRRKAIIDDHKQKALNKKAADIEHQAHRDRKAKRSHKDGENFAADTAGEASVLAGEGAASIAEEPLAIKDEPMDPLRIHGGPNLLHTIAAARRFIFRTGGAMYFDEIDSEASPNEPVYSDHNINVCALPLTANVRSTKENHDQVNAAQEDPEQLEHDLSDNEIRQSVVNSMFWSDWSRDALYETELKDVKLPIKQLWMLDPHTGQKVEYDGPLPDGTQELPNPNLKVWVRKPWPGVAVQTIPPTTPQDVSLSYIVSTYPVRGKFLIEKAKAITELTKNSYKYLTRGENVTLPSGRVVVPEEVLGEAIPGKTFAFIDIPTLAYVDSFLSRPEWQDEKLISKLDMIVWMLGSGVSAHPGIQSFINSHGTMIHTFASPDYCPNRYAMWDVANTTALLEQINPIVFSTPLEDRITVPQKLLGSAQSSAPPLLDNHNAATIDMKIKVRPEIKYGSEEVTISRTRELSRQLSEYTTSAQETNRKQTDAIVNWISTLNAPNTEITTLGTGSAIPSKYRNVSSTLVRVPGHGSYLIDCGENTVGQMKRMFTPDKLVEILKDLKMIWISHLHADHHLGTVGVMKLWYDIVHKGQKGPFPESTNVPETILATALDVARNGNSPLAIVCGEAMSTFLLEYAMVEDFGLSRSLMFGVSGAKADNLRRRITYQSQVFLLPTHEKVDRDSYAALLGVTDIQAVFVEHCYMAQAVAFSVGTANKKQIKIAYSGDCRPSAPFAMIGRNADVLIHEATFDDGLVGDARAKNHCTTSEALLVAEAMAAKAVVLTHFSQRYQNMPVIKPSLSNTEPISASDVEEAADGALEELIAYNRPRGASPKIENKRNSISRISWENRRDARKSNMKMCVAFDYMRLKVSDIASMEAYSPAFNQLYEEFSFKENKAGPLAVNEGSPSKKQKKKRDSR